MSKKMWVLGGLCTFATAVFLALLFAPKATTVITYVAGPMNEASTAPQDLPGASVLPAAVVAAPKVASLDHAAEIGATSVVNILCNTAGSPYKPISGSGVFVSPAGIILTAAHVGQYFILKDYPKPSSITCTIRTGNPAHAAYEAVPIYLSTHWVTANQGTLNEVRPVGTGESDFALLLVTKSLTNTPLPTTFPFSPLSLVDPTDKEPVVVAAYGAEFIEPDGIANALPIIISRSSVAKRYTFDVSTVDLVSISDSPAAQEGSSGGAVIESDGSLIGLITTSSDESDVALRNLRAITPNHIRRSFYTDAGMSLDDFIEDGNDALLERFKTRAKELADILIRATR